MAKRLSKGERLRRNMLQQTRKAVRLEAATVKKLVADLKRFRANVTDSIARASGFQAFHLRNIRNSINDELALLEERMAATMAQGIKNSVRLGGQTGALFSRTLGVGVGVPVLSPALISTIANLSAELVTNISAEILSSINIAVSRGVLGELSQFDVIQRIGEFIPATSKAGATYRAEMIARTEMNRAYNTSQFGTMQEVAAADPALRKTWITAGDTRVRSSHVDAGVNYVAGGSPGAIPANEPFQLQGGTVMYPADPGGPAAEVINCRCQLMWVTEEEGQ